MRIPESTINEIAERADMIAIMSRYLQLRRVGSRYVASCPFHNERTPSFHVDPDRGFWHCFGCKESGNIFSFLMKSEGMGFYEAVQKLAAEVGVELPLEYAPSQDTEKKRGYELLNRVCELYGKILLAGEEGGAGREYLKKRRISRSIAEKFRLGYAPPNGAAFWKTLKEAGFSEAEAQRCGVLNQRSRELLGGRLIFPICDFRGRVIAMGGRRIVEDNSPKYINFPETKWYSKRHHLYGLNVARGQISRENRAIVTEGYLDVIAMHQVGIGCCVATLGTALTPEQADLCKKYTGQVILAYDGDDAGINAVIKGNAVLEEAGLQVMTVSFPEGEDPDSLARKGGREAIEKVLAESCGIVKFEMNHQLNKFDVSTPEGKEGFVKAVMPFIAKIRNPVRREAYLRELEYYVGELSLSALRRSLQKAAPNGQGVSSPAGISLSSARRWIDLSSEERLLSLCSLHPEWAADLQNLLDISLIEDAELAEIFGRIWAMKDRHKPIMTVELFGAEDPMSLQERVYRLFAVEAPESELDDAKKLALDIVDKYRKKRLAILRPQVLLALKKGTPPDQVPNFEEYKRLLSES
ncbi:DNA primase [bacterium]|nr:DNA primase [bacterium]